jgi:2-oxoglutarate ferredoxin oxidoreductase subunit delta
MGNNIRRVFVRLAVESNLAIQLECSFNSFFSSVFDLTMNGHIEIDQFFCKGCELCVHFCPQKIISISEKLNASGYRVAELSSDDGCTGCATCAVVCPEAAIEVYRD